MGFFSFRDSFDSKRCRVLQAVNPSGTCLEPFSSLANQQRTYVETIQVTDHRNNSMLIIASFDVHENAFVIGSTTWWLQIVSLNKLKPKVMLRFYRRQDQHYLIGCKKFIYHGIESLPEFRPKNFPFELELDEYSILCNWIAVPTEEVRNHLSAIGIPAKTHNMESLYFTNTQNKERRLKILLAHGSLDIVYMLLLGVCLCENNLGNGDVIKFYKPVGPLKPRHFFSRRL